MSQKATIVRFPAPRILPVAAVLLLVAASLGPQAGAAIVDFTGVTSAAVSSAFGQTFNYTVGASSGTLTVKLVGGQVGSLQTGSAPDPNGFYGIQSAGDLTPGTFRFTFDVPRTFQISQNESLANIEKNAFTLPSGSWSILALTDASVTNNGSNVGFVGNNGSPPYGYYAIQGSGPSFDYQITNLPGYPQYGSAISLNVIVPEPSSAVLLLGSGAMLLRRRRRA